MIDSEARDSARRANNGVNDLYGQIGGLAADVAAIRRESSHGRWVVGIVVTVVGLGTASLTQVQVARIAALKPAQDDYAAEQKRQRDVDAIAARVASRIDELQTELERQRRGAPAPLGAPDVVAARGQ